MTFPELDKCDRLRQFRAYEEMLQLSVALQESGLTADELYCASRDELEGKVISRITEGRRRAVQSNR